MNIKITKNENLKNVPEDYSKLVFGKNFTDYMLLMSYKNEQWQPAEIFPFGNLSLSPATSSLHYGQLIFEGMKCYGTEDGSLQMFRPEENIKRMNRSAKRMCMPELDLEYTLGALKELLRLERRWVPKTKGTALYLRPTMMSTEPFLGVHAAKEYLFFVILSPVGSYFKAGFKPVKIMVEDKYIRAAPGGVGEAKTAGNYAASMYAAEKAAEKGFSQVLWLDGRELKYVEEVGAMNMAFVIDGEVVTPDLDGTILPGITRNSVIEVCKHMGIPITERRISITEIIEAAKTGHLEEAFGMGTAAVIAPVGSITYKDEVYTINNFKVGPISQKLFDEITGIQNGTKEDFANWITKFN
ncbi:MAG: branched-chain amino acid aminotransferase [Promethearchaeota archaeon]